MPDYPKAQRAAAQLANCLKTRLDQASPLTEVAIVADTGPALTQGYIVASGRKGPVHVVGAPLGSIVPGMRILIRYMNQNTYVYDGTAPSPLVTGTTSGSVIYTGMGKAVAANPLSGPLLTIPGGAPAQGWFWSFFFYLPSLPAVNTYCCLLDMPLISAGAVTGGFRIIYNYTGTLNAYFYGSAFGNPTPGPATPITLSPHRIWWLTLQLGNGLAINGQAISGLTGVDGYSNTLSAGTYDLFLLSDSANGSLPPYGSWISKVNFGHNYAAGNVLWPYNLSGFIPSADSQIANGTTALGAGLKTYLRYLTGDSVGTTTLTDTSASALNLTINGSLVRSGPY